MNAPALGWLEVVPAPASQYSLREENVRAMFRGLHVDGQALGLE